MKVFFSNIFCNEFITRYNKNSSCIISVIIFSKNSYRKHSYIDNLPLGITYTECISDAIVSHDNKECNNRKYKLLKNNKKSTSCYNEKIHSCTSSTNYKEANKYKYA